MNRLIQFDYLRVISIVCILLCHTCFDIGEFGWFGRYLGSTFNFLFLLLSAFLLGSSWESKGRPEYKIDFLINRIVKLSKTYYPYMGIPVFKPAKLFVLVKNKQAMRARFFFWGKGLRGSMPLNPLMKQQAV